jgi:hypothetical protein
MVSDPFSANFHDVVCPSFLSKFFVSGWKQDVCRISRMQPHTKKYLEEDNLEKNEIISFSPFFSFGPGHAGQALYEQHPRSSPKIIALFRSGIK